MQRAVSFIQRKLNFRGCAGESKMKIGQEQRVTEPLLIAHSVLRSGRDSPLPGAYDEKESIWLVTEGYRSLPIVTAHRDLATLVTKTEADRERDDADMAFSPSLLNLVTKTKAFQERDDE